MEYVLSLATNKKHAVYHTEACPYTKRIKFKNRVMVPYSNIISSGYQPCACCTNDSRYLKLWLKFFDVKGTHSLEKILNYIKEHDKAKVIMDEDWRKLPTRTKRQKKYYKSAEKRDRRRQVRNVVNVTMFFMLILGLDFCFQRYMRKPSKKLKVVNWDLN